MINPLFYYQAIVLALRQIWANKTRSFLTTLGIIIGVASVTAVIADLSRLRVKFHLLTEQAELLREGQIVRLALPRQANSQQAKSQLATPVTGTVKYVSPITAAKSLTVRVDVVIDNSRNRLRSGIPIRIEL